MGRQQNLLQISILKVRRHRSTGEIQCINPNKVLSTVSELVNIRGQILQVMVRGLDCIRGHSVVVWRKETGKKQDTS